VDAHLVTVGSSRSSSRGRCLFLLLLFLIIFLLFLGVLRVRLLL
jgi:hypothetical protein